MYIYVYPGVLLEEDKMFIIPNDDDDILIYEGYSCFPSEKFYFSS